MTYPRKVQRQIGKKAGLGPISADMILYFVLSLVLAFAIRAALKLSWPVALFILFAQFVFWFAVVGKHGWKFYSMFINPKKLVRVSPLYISQEQYNDEREKKHKENRRKKGSRARVRRSS